jgi:hypothetical protein
MEQFTHNIDTHTYVHKTPVISMNNNYFHTSVSSGGAGGGGSRGSTVSDASYKL